MILDRVAIPLKSLAFLRMGRCTWRFEISAFVAIRHKAEKYKKNMADFSATRVTLW